MLLIFTIALEIYKIHYLYLLVLEEYLILYSLILFLVLLIALKAFTQLIQAVDRRLLFHLIQTQLVT